MQINILHIDDEVDVLKAAGKVISGHQMGDATLVVKDSCGFEEGMKKLEQEEYDLVILDLCVGKASSASDKIGDVVFDDIKKRAFIPVVFFTGLPDYVRPLISNIVRVASKAEGYDSLFKEIGHVIGTNYISLKKDIYFTIGEGLRGYFWNFVHPHSSIIESLQKDKVSLKYILMRRLGRTFGKEILNETVGDTEIKKDHSHPIEFYIYPPLDGEFETGDLVKSNKSGEISILLTPTCDFVLRNNGKRSADKVLLVHTQKFSDMPEFKKMTELKEKEVQAQKKGASLSKEEAGQLKGLPGKMLEMMKPGFKERYFFLPPTPFMEPTFIDFQSKDSIPYSELEADYKVIASLDDPIAQAVLSSYARYFSRIGYPDLDAEYVLKKILG